MAAAVLGRRRAPGVLAALAVLPVLAVVLGALLPAEAGRAAAPAPGSAAVLPGDGDEDVTLPGGRRYRLHAPPGLTPGAPAVLVLHGLGTEPGDVAVASQFSAAADASGLLVAYPYGRWRSWNAGTCCGRAVTEDVDDVAFLTAVVADLRRRGAGAVTAVGFSNGGMMAYRLACERPDVVARVGVVAGSLQVPDCPAPIDVVHVHGLLDDRVPYAGAAWAPAVAGPVRPAEDEPRLVGRGRVRLLPLPGVGHQWPHRRDGLDATAEFVTLALGGPAAGGPVR